MTGQKRKFEKPLAVFVNLGIALTISMHYRQLIDIKICDFEQGITKLWLAESSFSGSRTDALRNDLI